MTLPDLVLCGDRSAISALVSSAEGLCSIVAFVARGEPALEPRFADALAETIRPRTWRARFCAGADAWREREEEARGEILDEAEVEALVGATLRWTLRSLRAARPATDLASLEAALVAEAEEPDPSSGTVAETVAAIEAVAPDGELLAWTRTELLPWIARKHAALLLVEDRYATALERLAAIAAAAQPAPLASTTWGWQLPADRPGAIVTPARRAARELADIVAWADESTPEWVRGLGTLAVRLGREGHPEASLVRAAFERGLDHLADLDPAGADEALRIVEDQLQERGERDAAELARARRVRGDA